MLIAARIIAILLATFVLTVFSAAQSQPTPSQNPKPSGVTRSAPTQDAQKPGKRNGTQAAPGPAAPIIPTEQPTPLDAAAQKRENREEEHLKIDRQNADSAMRSAKAAEALTVSTDGLVGVTWALVIVGAIGSFLLIAQLYYVRKSVIDTGESVKLARAEFNATHRPRIAVRSIGWTVSPTKKTASISFQYVNIGDSKGWVTEIHYGLMITGAEPASDPQLIEEKMGRTEMFIGQRKTFVFNSRELFNMWQIATTRPSSEMDQTAYLIGQIVYTDIDGRRREMGFCRVTQGTSHRWAVVKDSEHEYCD